MGKKFDDLKKQQRETIRDILSREHMRYMLQSKEGTDTKAAELILTTAYQYIMEADIPISKEEVRMYYRSKIKRFNQQFTERKEGI